MGLKKLTSRQERIFQLILIPSIINEQLPVGNEKYITTDANENVVFSNRDFTFMKESLHKAVMAGSGISHIVDTSLKASTLVKHLQSKMKEKT